MNTNRNNDTSYIELEVDIINNYFPKNKLSMELVDKYIDLLHLSEEGDNVITGSFRSWLLLIGRIIDMYIDFRKNSPDDIFLDLSGFSNSGRTFEPVMDDLLVYLKNDIYVPDDQKIFVEGTKPQFDKFFQMFKLIEKRRKVKINPN
jgi:hypothetical protein